MWDPVYQFHGEFYPNMKYKQEELYQAQQRFKCLEMGKSLWFIFCSNVEPHAKNELERKD